MIMKKILINLCFGLSISTTALAHTGQPFCANKKDNSQLVIGYLVCGFPLVFKTEQSN